MGYNFKDIEPRAVLPDRIREETLGQLETIKLLMGMVDLFTSKAGSTIGASLSASISQPSLPSETLPNRLLSDPEESSDEDGNADNQSED